jgi:hypothetical protein
MQCKTHTTRITAATLAEQVVEPAPPVVLDVWTPREWANKHIAGFPKCHRIGTS